ncbi:MAG: HEAT repeat domain-containing protein [Pseudomonadota bacterium]|nr:HEAT repeat domain-containing protein [Pseudomonadota bacterium]
MKRRINIFLSCFLFWTIAAASAFAATELGREDALKALENSDTEIRAAAADRLGDVGAMEDVVALLNSLRDDNETVRNTAEQAIWRIWARSGDPSVDRLYARGIREMNEGSLVRAISTFTEIIKLKPDFAEGWNKRATLYFMTEQYDKSLEDCDEVMKRNPYHFGALSGYGHIHVEFRLLEQAIEYFQRALKINPNMGSIARLIVRLERQIKDQRDKTV